MRFLNTRQAKEMYSVNLAEPVPSSRNINAAVKHKKMNKSSDAP